MGFKVRTFVSQWHRPKPVGVLDSVNLVEVVQQTCARDACSPDGVGAFRSALKLAMQEIVDGARSEDLVRCTWAWKLFFLLPRMLLFRPVRRGLVPGPSWRRGSDNFSLAIGLHCCWRQLQFQRRLIRSVKRRRRDTKDNEAKRVVRAMARVQLGDLSAARQVLEGAEVAAGTLATLAELTNPERRPQVPRQPINEDIMRMVPGEQFQLDLIGLRKARRGAAAGRDDFRSSLSYPGK